MFLANNREEFDAITAAIYGSSYQDELILQEYIPGDDNCMRVLNAYCGLDHKVKLMALGRPLLEEQTPEGIGNYAAILSDPEYNDAALLEKLKNFFGRYAVGRLCQYGHQVRRPHRRVQDV